MLLDLLVLLTSIFGVLMSIGHFFQAQKIVANKSAKDVSLVMYLIFTIGSYIWFTFGIVTNSVPVMLSFGIAVLGTTLVLFLKLRYK